MRSLKRLLAVVLSLAMVIGSLTVTAFADNSKNKIISASGTYNMDGNYYGISGIALTVNTGVTATVNAGSWQIYNKSLVNSAIKSSATSLTLNSETNIIYNYANSTETAANTTINVAAGKTIIGEGTTVAKVASTNLTTPLSDKTVIWVGNGAEVDVNGAIIAGKINLTDGGTITKDITSGYFGEDLSEYCADGYTCIADTTKTGCSYKVQKATEVATVTVDGTETTYYSIDKAVAAAAAASDSATITMINDVTTSGLGQITSSNAITLDLAGKTITCTSQFIRSKIGGGFTISDSVGGGKITSALTSISSGLIYNNIGADLTINGGTFESSQTSGYLINSSGFGKGNIVIHGGTFKANGATLIRANSAADVTVDGGIFYGDPSDDSVILVENTTSGGTVGNKTLSTVTNNNDGTWTVSVPAIKVEIGEETSRYDTLADAVAAIDAQTASTTATITILKDIEVSERVETKVRTDTTVNNITINLLDNTITYTGSSTGVILARAYSYFTIKGTGTIEITNNSYIFAANRYSQITIKEGHFKNSSSKDVKYLANTMGYTTQMYVQGGQYNFDPSSYVYSYEDKTTSEKVTKTIDYNITGEVINNGDGTYKVGIVTVDGGDIGYGDLQFAMQTVSEGGTLTIFGSGNITSALYFNKGTGNVTVNTINITDDGNAHTLYFDVPSNSASGEIVMGYGKTLNITATAANNIKICGCNVDGDEYSNKPIFYPNSSSSSTTALTLKNVEMANCQLSSGSGACISNSTSNASTVTVTIDSCYFHDNTAASGGSCIYNKGALNITNTTFEDNTAGTNGTIYNYGGGTLKLTSSTMTGNTAKLGAAIYNYGSASVFIYKGNTITGNTSTGDAGAIYVNKDSSGSYGYVYLNGINNTIKDNLKQTQSGQEGDESALEGVASDICILYNDSLVVAGSLYGGTIGIDASFAESEGEAFAKVTASSVTENTLAAFFSNANSDFGAYYNSSSKTLYWEYYLYSLSIGSAKTQVSGTLYSYNVTDVSVTQDIHSAAKNLAVHVDSGKITVDWDALTIDNITAINVIDSDGTGHTYTEKPSGKSNVKAISIQVSDTLADSEITGFIKGLVFTTAGNAVEQSIYAGIYKEIPENYVYFAGGYYTYVSTEESWDIGNNNAALVHGKYPSILNQTDNDIVSFITGGNATWLAATKAYDAWYWKGGVNDGVQISANADTTEGLDGAYVNWASSTPFVSADYEKVYMTDEGKWLGKDGLETSGYVIEKEDDNASAAKQTFMLTKDSKNILTGIEASLDSDIAMTYYFTFSDAYKASTAAYVSIQVDGEDAVVKTVSELISEQPDAGEGGYAITVNYEPKKLNAQVVIKVCDGEGAETTYGSGDGYNYLYYANTVMANYEAGKGDDFTQNYSAEHDAMVKALLHYGAAAQVQFDYNTSDLADSGISAAGEVDPSKINTDNCVFTQSSGEIFTKAALVSDSMTGLRIYFTGSATTADVNGVSYDVKSDSTGNYVEFPIAAQNLAKIYTVIINDESCNINAYYVINQIVNDSSASTNAKTTAFRLFEFGEAAADYYGTYAPSASVSEAILNTAFAFYAHGSEVQYDQKAMSVFSVSGDYNTARRQVRITPEDMTTYKDAYLDCSSFIQVVLENAIGYKNAFTSLGYETTVANGLDTSTMVRDEKKEAFAVAATGTDDIYPTEITNAAGDELCRWGSGTTTTSLADQATAKGKTIDDLYAALRYNLQPGDIVVKYRNENETTGTDAHGHVMIWTGDGFIHCTGSSYDYSSNKDKWEDNGSIYYIPASQFEEVFDLATFNKVVIIRPTQTISSTDDLTDYGTARQQIGPLEVEMTAKFSTSDLYEGSTVVDGSTLSFNITLDNSVLSGALGAARTVNLQYVLPDGVTLSDAGGASVSGTTLTWSDITLARDEKKVITIEVKVDEANSSSDVYGRNMITSDEDTGKGIATVKISAAGNDAKAITFALNDIYILNVTGTDKTKLTTAITNLLNGTKTYTGVSGLGFVNAIYETAGVASNFRSAFTTDDGLFKGIYTSGTTSSSSIYYLPNYSGTAGKYISQNFVGGRRFISNESDSYDLFSYNNRSRVLLAKNLNAGDIIACTSLDSDNVLSYTYYIYPTKGSETMVKISGSEYSSVNTEDVLDELLGANSTWAVLTVIGR